MSLLMDALKKAEREREAQASKEQGEAPEKSQELSLDPMEQLAGDDESEAPPAPPSRKDSSWDLLADEPSEAAFDLDFGDVDMDLDSALGDVRATRERPAALDDVPLTAPGDDFSLDDTSATMPSMKAVKASVDRYFDGAESASMSAPLPTMEQDDATTVVRTRDSAEAQAAAQTVFQAKRRPRSSGWVWVPVGLMFFLLLIGGGVYYYFAIIGDQTSGIEDLAGTVGVGPATTATGAGNQTGANAGGSVDTRATGASASVGTVTADQAATSAATTTATGGTDADSLLARLDVPAVSDVLEAEPPPVGDLTPDSTVATEIKAAAGTESGQQSPSPEALLASADQQIAAALGGDNLAGANALRGEGLQLTRRSAAPRVNPRVLSGYQAFQRNDLATAETNYRAALRDDPSNRDALLGLAAIAVKKQRTGFAAQIYREILRINPRDSIAQAALMALSSNATTATESQLKLMLEREPDASHLHFNLGNYYASQSLWPEAQNAYFNAFRLDSANPDYAYNLAIGLDHLAQSTAALKYYRLALDLASVEPSGFQQSAVLRRIESITQ